MIIVNRSYQNYVTKTNAKHFFGLQWYSERAHVQLFKLLHYKHLCIMHYAPISLGIMCALAPMNAFYLLIKVTNVLSHQCCRRVDRIGYVKRADLIVPSSTSKVVYRKSSNRGQGFYLLSRKEPQAFIVGRLILEAGLYFFKLNSDIILNFHDLFQNIAHIKTRCK